MTKQSKQRKSLIKRHNGLCTNCGCRVVDIRSIQNQNILWQSHFYVCHTDDLGNVFFDAIATVEHIVPLAVGGENTLKNITLHCMECNHIKEVLFNKVNPSKEEPLQYFGFNNKKFHFYKLLNEKIYDALMNRYPRRTTRKIRNKRNECRKKFIEHLKNYRI